MQLNFAYRIHAHSCIRTDYPDSESFEKSPVSFRMDTFF